MAPGSRSARRMVALSLAVLLAVAAYGFVAFRQEWFPFRGDPPREVTVAEAQERFERGSRADGAARPFTPAAGVYVYEGRGSESLSNPPRSQPEGPRVPGTVTHQDDGCWSLRLDYSTNHWRRWDYCARDDELVGTGSVVSQRWDFGAFAVENVTTLRCQPPAVVLRADMTVGDEWTSKCRGESTQIEGTTVSTGTHRFLGIEHHEVDGREVEAFHFREHRRVSGAQSGTERFDLWLDRSGLVLQVEQRIEVDSGSPIGNVTYTQQSRFALVSTPSG